MGLVLERLLPSELLVSVAWRVRGWWAENVMVQGLKRTSSSPSGASQSCRHPNSVVAVEHLHARSCKCMHFASVPRARIMGQPPARCKA